ncbi:MAG: carboxylesterase family protein [Planctomycetota bacterium]
MEDLSITSGGQCSQVFEKTITKTISCKYLLFLPAGYGENEQKWPLILFLHGAGERGDDLEKVKLHGPPKIVEKQKDFPFILVSPQCPEEKWWPNEIDMLINLLDDIVSRYNVDTERVYLTGLSMGGYGAWRLATEYPERFAAMAPICGGGIPALADKLKDVPVWAFHGAKDDVIPLKESSDMVNALKECGGDAKLTVYPEAEHDSWTETYENDELYKWLLEHRKSKEK